MVSVHLWRQGRSIGRTIYLQKFHEPTKDDQLIGLMDTPELAEYVCRCVNHCIIKGVDLGVGIDASKWE